MMMKRNILVVLALAFAASAAPAAADDTQPPLPTVGTSDADCPDPFGSVTFENLTPEYIALVEPGGRTYTEDGTYPLPAGTYSVYVFIPAGPIVDEVTWTIQVCPSQRPRVVKRTPPRAPLPPLPETSTIS